ALEGGDDASFVGHVAGAMGEGVEVEVAAHVAVEPLQQVEGERGGDTGGVVVGRFDDRRVLLQVQAQQGGAALAHGGAPGGEQADRLVEGEVAQGRGGGEELGR